MTAGDTGSAGWPTPGALVLVDAMNVIGSRPDGWWRDRRGAVRRLVADLARLVEERDVRVVVVVDGRPDPDLAERYPAAGRSSSTAGSPLQVGWADRRGPDAADDRIVELLAEGCAGATVVTADRDLRARVRGAGGRVVGPSTLRAALDRTS